MLDLPYAGGPLGGSGCGKPHASLFAPSAAKVSQGRQRGSRWGHLLICHQIEKTGLGTEATFVGNVVIAKPVQNDLRPEYGPFDIDKGYQTVMHSSTATYVPTRGDHMRDAGLCGSCHTLYTSALGPRGEKVAKFPEQMPFQEWQHSDYATKQTCQDCHMPVVNESVPVTACTVSHARACTGTCLSDRISLSKGCCRIIAANWRRRRCPRRWMRR